MEYMIFFQIDDNLPNVLTKSFKSYKDDNGLIQKAWNYMQTWVRTVLHSWGISRLVYS